MAKVKTTFFCQNCGAQSGKWIGKCPSCGEWNTYVEEVIEKTSSAKTSVTRLRNTTVRPRLISEIESREEERFSSPIWNSTGYWVVALSQEH
jgi:DNA repair protein RadA/Sms